MSARVPDYYVLGERELEGPYPTLTEARSMSRGLPVVRRALHPTPGPDFSVFGLEPVPPDAEVVSSAPFVLPADAPVLTDLPGVRVEERYSGPLVFDETSEDGTRTVVDPAPRFIEIAFATGVVSHDLQEEWRASDESRAAKNRAALAAGRRPASAADVNVGDLVLPLGLEQWQRGPGLVDEVDNYGNVWAVFGQRERPHPSDDETLRCFMPWDECVVVGRAHPHPECTAIESGDPQ